MFSGTPCQIAAIKKYVGNRQNLYTIDIVCNGITSSLALKQYLTAKYLCPEKIEMRQKDWYHGTIYYKCFFVKAKNKVYRERVNYFLSGYYSGEFSRISCFSCPYAIKERISDFTIGDVHKTYNELTAEAYKNGVSVLLVNTKKGKQIQTYLSEFVEITEVPYEQIYTHSSRLCTPGKKPKGYPDLLNGIINGDKNPDKYIASKVNVLPMWRQKLGEMIPDFIFDFVKK